MVWGIFIRSLILTDITTKWLRFAKTTAKFEENIDPGKETFFKRFTF